jgi:hypothetical protein
MNPVLLLTLAAFSVNASTATGPPFNTEWFTSRKGSNLTVNKDNVLTWSLEDTDGVYVLPQPRHESLHDSAMTKTTAESIITNLAKPISLANAGDMFQLNVDWLSTGTHTNECDPSYYANGAYCLKEEKETCVSHTPECLSGTGDFRIAFFDTKSSKDSGQIKSDNFADTTDYNVMRTMMQKAPFVNWRGYNLHFFPHVSKGAKKYTPTDRGIATPSSFCYR